MPGPPDSSLGPYLVAIAAVGLLAAVLLTLGPVLGPGLPFGAATLAAIASGCYGGAGPALLALGLGGLAVGALAPGGLALAGEPVPELVAGGLYSGLGAGIVALSAAWRRQVHDGVRPELPPREASADPHASAAEQALRESREQLERAVAATGLGTWNLNPETGALSCSDRCREIFGISPGEPIHFEQFLSLVHPEDRERTNSAVRQALSGAGSDVGALDIEYRVIRPSGALRWVVARGRADFDGTGESRRAARFTGTIQDITARRRAEQELIATEAIVDAARTHAQRVLESMTDAFFALDTEWRFTYLNPQAEPILRRQRDELLGKTLWEEFLETSGSPTERQLREAVAQGRSTTFETFDSSLDSWFEIRAYPSADGLSVYFHDISERKQSEARILRLNRELEERVRQRTEALSRANAELRAFTTRLEWSNRELQEFASVASHDLQEPLRKIQAFGDRLEARCGAALDDQGRDYLGRMRNAASRMRTLIEDLLRFSRVTTRAQPFTPLDLGAVAREVLADLEERVAQTGGRVEIAALPVVDADPLQMRQLLQNLIGNGLKFHREGVAPQIQVRGELRDDDDAPGHAAPVPGPVCRIEIQDNGIGFDEKYLDRIFNVFQRLHGRNEYEGTGMGLAICRRIVERHRGRLTARSAPGQGATFLVTLPRQQPREEDQP